MSRRADRRTQGPAHSDEDHGGRAFGGYCTYSAELFANLLIIAIGGNQLAQLSRLLATLVFKDLRAIHGQQFPRRFYPTDPPRQLDLFCHAFSFLFVRFESRVSFGIDSR